MDLSQLLEATKDQVTVSRVFGEPFDRDGVTVVPVARIIGGGGGGIGTAGGGDQGEGGGVGFVARPEGVYVIRRDEVHWRPAIDANRLVAASAVVLVVGLLARAMRQRSG